MNESTGGLGPEGRGEPVGPPGQGGHDGYEPRPGLTHGGAHWAGLRVLVAGLGVSGFVAADALQERGAHVVLVDGAAPGSSRHADDQAGILEVLDVDVRRGTRPDGRRYDQVLPEEPFDLVVTSPGWPPHQPLLAAAAAAGIPIWGEVELAWRMRPERGAAPWLTITGTNGKTTTVTMLETILRRSGLRARAVGNVGTPILEAILDPQPYDVLAVELSSFQLHWQRSVSPLASVCLNVAPDHLDWHGSYEDYLAAKAKVYANTQVACLYNVEDPQTEEMVVQAEVVEGCRAVGFTRGVPAVSMLGVVDDMLADRAFVEQRRHNAAELGTLADLRGDNPPGTPVAPHYVANALAAAGLARAFGVGPLSVRDGLRDYRPQGHRIAHVGVVDGVAFVDDSKATNPHAASSALSSYDGHEHRVVWVAGGQLKGASVEQLVADHAGRLRGAVVLGADRALLAEALARHAPDVPVVEVPSGETGAMGSPAEVMQTVVERAFALARPGDTVLLSPAGASKDMWHGYDERGADFAAAVARLAADRSAGQA